MGEVVRVAESIELPVPVEEVWEFLGDTRQMVAMDPALEAFAPENGAVEVGTVNRITIRLGPFRARIVTRTEVLDPPNRVMFVGVSPARPVHVVTEDTLEPSGRGCRYTVMHSVTPTFPVIGSIIAPLVARGLARTRRTLMERIRNTLE